MELKESDQRGRVSPLLFTALGVFNVFGFFYKSTHQSEDLLQGVGFLLVVPLAYFAPTTFLLGTRARRPHVPTWLNGMAIAGLALVVTGFALGWGRL